MIQLVWYLPSSSAILMRGAAKMSLYATGPCTEFCATFLQGTRARGTVKSLPPGEMDQHLTGLAPSCEGVPGFTEYVPSSTGTGA